ncbi:MAG: 50S ribosomal protein L11 methyltransferase, partial [Bacteroidota bacterium]
MTNEPSIELTLNLSPHLHDLLVAELDAVGFNGFVQEETRFQAYIPPKKWVADAREVVQHWLQLHAPGTTWQEQEIVPQDWNKAWEASIQPIRIAPFYVRPSWAPAVEGFIDIVVDPKMSFGTGHHETTRLLLKMMPDHITPGCDVLDAGTGTAILAIAATKLDAGKVFAFDIDPWVSENVAENLALNAATTSVSFSVGGMDVVPDTTYDV